jgi:2-isopropylmalate synthase
VLKNPLTYEIMTPESVGLKNTNLVLGKLSGRAAFQDRMKELGFELCARRQELTRYPKPRLLLNQMRI